MAQVAKVKFIDYQTSIAKALDLIGAGENLPQDGLIIIKPNLTNSSPPPVTTSVAAAEAVYKYCKTSTKAKIAIGDGCGSGKTADVFKTLGYTKFAERCGIELLDFNEAETITVKNENAFQLKTFHMPKIVKDAYIISLPVLKDHSFTETTIAMKNMFGIAPGKFYAGGWNKSKLHSPSTDKSVVDICLYKKPALSVVDASVALKGMHLSGTHKKLGLILAGFDPVAVDTIGSELLGHNPKKLPFLTLANGLLGSMNNIQILSA
ncbi:MAG: DUF362 domain-containing protein [Sedimentisphaerales bacterium]|nr:DUF362 domain-containing protein [Sedimentisphaerales bacterium]